MTHKMVTSKLTKKIYSEKIRINTFTTKSYAPKDSKKEEKKWTWKQIITLDKTK